MIVKIKKLHPDAVIPFKHYDTDFCFDCVAVSEEEIAPNVWKYGLGFAVQPLIPRFGGTNASLDIRPRSSVWKTGMVLSNSVGTVDQDYTGEVSAVFYHVMPNMPRYRVGDRVCQVKVGVTSYTEFKEVEELVSTDRGDGGYGSTGK